MKTIILSAAVVCLTSCAEISTLSVDTPWGSGSKDALGNVTLTPKFPVVITSAK